MGLLNLDKFKKGGETPQNQAQVPDELPSLPAEQKEENKAAEVKQEAEIAPDELPPIPEELKKEPTAPVVQTPSQDVKADISVSGISDSKLYFSELMSRMNGQGSIEELEKELTKSDSRSIFTNLNSYWDEQKQQQGLMLIEKTIKERIPSLQKLEQDWRNLKADVNQKLKLLKEKEDQIKNSTVDLKLLIQKRNQLKNRAIVKLKKARKLNKKTK